MRTRIAPLVAGLATTLAACSPAAAADMMPMNPSQQVPEASGTPSQSGSPASMDPAALKEAAPPPIVLTEDLTDANPKGLATRLSALLKVEVRSTLGGLRKVTLKAGEWTATRLLEEAAEQLHCGWRQEFRLEASGRAPAANGGTPARTPEMQSTLPSPGRVTCFAPLLSFSRVVAVIRDATGCRIVLPDRVPTTRHKVAWKEVPMEDALAEVARAGGFTLVRCVVLEEPESMAAAQQQEGVEAMTAAVVRKADVSGWLTAAYGEDPTGPDFPWDSIDLGNLAMSAAPALDLVPAEARDLFEQLRGEATTRTTVDVLERAADAPPPPPAAPMQSP